MSASRSAARVLVTAIAVGTLFGSTFQAAHAVRERSSAAPAAVKKTKNLIKNPGAEAGTGSADGSTVSIPNWTPESGSTSTAVKYGVPGGFPTAQTPGPPKRGKNFFAGGPGTTDSVIYQAISLTSYHAAIGAGNVKFAFKGWLGGFGNNADSVTVELTFQSAGSVVVGNVFIDGPTNVQRHDVTKLLSRSKTGKVPTNAQVVYVLIVSKYSDGGYNDGYADNLSLVLSGA